MRKKTGGEAVNGVACAEAASDANAERYLWEAREVVSSRAGGGDECLRRMAAARPPSFWCARVTLSRGEEVERLTDQVEQLWAKRLNCAPHFECRPLASSVWGRGGLALGARLNIAAKRFKGPASADRDCRCNL